ncbi:ATP-dependent DNA ligase [Streptomyces sp. NPDC049590]|uniref:non-homologous end-joining DNA ligase LigD n=1 Tax=Streptomyces sp. NPDC049590 TaxID=3154834 RepID=UPI003435B911
MSHGAARTIRAGRHTVELQRPGKVLFPGRAGAPGYTKGDLADYYRSVAPYLLPHLRGRPLMLERYPDGLDGERFPQKNVPGHCLDWITRAEVAKEGGTVTHVVRDDTATLLYLAGQACITLHRRLSRTDRAGGPGCPDRLVFDLDPPGDDFAAARHPDRLTTAARKKDRAGRLHLDVQRDAYARTAVAPYTVRALPGAPVAVPLAWKQVDEPVLDARRWTLADAVDQARTEPWAGLPRRGRSLGPARRRLDDMRS